MKEVRKVRICVEVMKEVRKVRICVEVMKEVRKVRICVEVMKEVRKVRICIEVMKEIPQHSLFLPSFTSWFLSFLCHRRYFLFTRPCHHSGPRIRQALFLANHTIKIFHSKNESCIIPPHLNSP